MNNQEKQQEDYTKDSQKSSCLRDTVVDGKSIQSFQGIFLQLLVWVSLDFGGLSLSKGSSQMSETFTNQASIGVFVTKYNKLKYYF